MTHVPRLPGRVADELADRVLTRAVAGGLLPARPLPDWGDFRRLRARVRETFAVPQTSVTPLMARLLFGIAHIARPARVLVVGSYYGNTLVWLAAPGFGPDAAYPGARALGVDVDTAAVDGARSNFARLGTDPRVTLETLDGHRLAAGTVPADDGFDLVLLDADDPVRRKRVYLTLLDALYPLVAPGGLVLAHDICVPLFAADLAEYQQAVRMPARFCASLSLEVDACGLEISKTVGRTVGTGAARSLVPVARQPAPPTAAGQGARR